MDRHLHHDHDQLRSIMRSYAEEMKRGADAFTTTLLRERVRFSQLFRAHMMKEEGLALSTLGDDPQRVKGSAEIQQLFRDYSAHISAWTPPQVKADWPGYCAAVLALQARLHARMDWEERVLHPRLPLRADA